MRRERGRCAIFSIYRKGKIGYLSRSHTHAIFMGFLLGFYHAFSEAYQLDSSFNLY